MVAVQTSPNSSSSAEWICCLDKRWAVARACACASAFSSQGVASLTSCRLGMIFIASRRASAQQWQPHAFTSLGPIHPRLLVLHETEGRRYGVSSVARVVHLVWKALVCLEVRRGVSAPQEPREAHTMTCTWLMAPCLNHVDTQGERVTSNEAVTGESRWYEACHCLSFSSTSFNPPGSE